MKQLWFVGGVLCGIGYAALRLTTLNGASPEWAARLQPFMLIAALVCMALAGRMNLSPRGISQMYERRARHSYFIGLICLVLIPIALWLIYTNYYQPLNALTNANADPFGDGG